MQQSLPPQVQSWNRPSSRSQACVRENVGYKPLTVLSSCASWSHRRLTTKISALRPKLNDVSSSSFLVVLSALCTYFLCSVKAQHIWLANHLKQTVNTFWLANLFTTFQVIASHSQACKTDRSWIVEHEINDEYISLLQLLTELSLACPLSLSIYTDHWWSHIR